MKLLKFLLLVTLTFIMFNCSKNNDSRIFYSDNINCSISTESLIIADSLNSNIQIDLINHSENDFSLKFLHIQINLVDSVTHKFYGSSILEFNSNNGNGFDLKNNSKVSISKNINELFWNTFLKTSELPAGNYQLYAIVSTGNMDENGNEIGSNMIRIMKK